MNKITIILLTLVVSSLAFAQTIIEDRVEIDPQKLVAYEPTSYKEHMLTLTVTWTPNPVRRARLEIIKCNGDTLHNDWSNSGILPLSFPAERGPVDYCYIPVQYLGNDGIPIIAIPA